MSREAKLLILTWVMIGLLVAGGVGFYLGRATAPKTQGILQDGIQPPGSQQLGPQSGQLQGSPFPTGRQQPPQGQQNPPDGGSQPLPQK
ncbi:MAG: hypothetical protein A3B47_04875 [Candidatus Levybacteria bacterium RIFCSPLOWO2_01_FULL_39_24]|nr:MAG: hypothetical protein A2800_04240 [Candidatus Levybacteria bacterium RIFCSPHIGHO2_01_FULL_40_16]OGH27964.1 MAG: hypothetical protein A3E12_02625 [Candidatus Levybacteria bacterium RIFCSPHIGHO2_12_FULL_39_9]OGH46772.1 MAG: hypothetical protein A3B47_04875 [Candidatus Levybacteria bacterium RIFCSPLOWO2_01_FULL_39_24]